MWALKLKKSCEKINFELSCHVTHFIRKFHTPAVKLYLSTVSRERYFLFHLPQCVYWFHPNGRDVLEASWSFIVRRITGLFCSFCTDFISLLRKFPFIHPFSQLTTKQILTFFFFYWFSCFIPLKLTPSFLLPWNKLPDSKLYVGHSQISFINFILSITQILILHAITFLNVLFIRKVTYNKNREIYQSSKTPEFYKDHTKIEVQNVQFNQQYLLSISYRADPCAFLIRKNKSLRNSLCPLRSFLL